MLVRNGNLEIHKRTHQYEIHLFKSMSQKKKKIKAHITLKTNQKPARHFVWNAQQNHGAEQWKLK